MKIEDHNDALKFVGENERKYLLLLEFHDNFERDIDDLRKRASANWVEGEMDSSLIRQELPELLKRNNIPFSLYHQIHEIIEHGVVASHMPAISVFGVWSDRKKLVNDKPKVKSSIWKTPTETQRDFVLKSRSTLNQNGNMRSYLPLIQINRRVSKNQLVEAIDDWWPEIENSMKQYELLLPSSKLLEKIPFRDIDAYIEIYRCYQKKIKVADIAKAASIEESSVRDIVSDMNKLLRNIGYKK